jgi:hypothetical protein
LQSFHQYKIHQIWSGRFETIQFPRQGQYLNLYQFDLTGFEKWAGGKINRLHSTEGIGPAQLALRAS